MSRNLHPRPSFPAVALATGLLLAGLPGQRAAAALGDCGQPVTGGLLPTATDALFALRAAVGAQGCLFHICDTDGNGRITAGDALRILRRAVIGLSIPFRCPTATTTTTTSTTTTSTTTTTTLPAGNIDLSCTTNSGTLTLATSDGSSDLDLSGTVSIQCGDPSTGSSACTCSLSNVEPILLGPIGYLCVAQTDRCSGGSLECQAGAGSGADIVSDHSIGACADNDSCAAACSSACAAAGKSMLSSGCEGFCAEGVDAGKTCTNFNECTDSGCNGVVNSHGNLCACHCVGPSQTQAGAGALQCRLGLRLTIERAPPCDGLDESALLGGQCVVLSSTEVASEFRSFDLTQATSTLGPLAGASLSCTALSSGNASGMTVVGAVNLVDSTLGDLIAAIQATCQ